MKFKFSDNCVMTVIFQNRLYTFIRNQTKIASFKKSQLDTLIANYRIKLEKSDLHKFLQNFSSDKTEEAVNAIANMKVDEEFIAEKIAKKKYIKSYLVDTRKFLVCYDKGVYSDAATIIDSEIYHEFDGAGYPSFKKEIVAMLEDMPSIRVDKSQFDADGFINLKNGWLNLKTMQLIPHSSERLSLFQLQVNYQKDTKATLFRQVLDRILTSRNQKILQKMFAYILLRGYPYKHFFYLQGAKDTGKTLILNVITEFFTQQYVTNQSLSDLSDKGSKGEYSIAELFNKRANISDDQNDDFLKFFGIIKGLTGNTLIRGRSIYSRPIKFRNEAKMIFSSNHALRGVMDDAFWDRMIIIAFDQDAITPAEDKPELFHELMSNKSGIFNWVLEGLKEEGFDDFNEEIKSEWKEESQPFKIWFQENYMITKVLTDFVSSQAIADRYRKITGAKVNSRVVGKELVAILGEEWRENNGTFKEARARGFRGIVPLSEFADEILNI